MTKERRTFSREFKLDALRMAEEEGRTIAAVARNLGIRPALLYKWKSGDLQDGAEAFPGKGQRPKREEELHQLKERLRRTEQERDILKKALAYFAREPK